MDFKTNFAPTSKEENDLLFTKDTPPNKWMFDDNKDPFGMQYFCDRKHLPMGELNDDQIANDVYLYNHRQGYASLAFLEAAKERIRWLSRQVIKLTVENYRLRQQLANLTNEEKRHAEHTGD